MVTLVLVSLAVWRITHLFNAEDGPFDLLVKFRRLFGDGGLGHLLDCFLCLSIWVALPMAHFLKPVDYQDYFVGWLAISGAACVIQLFIVKGVQEVK